MEKWAIKTQNLTKVYGKNIVVNNVNMNVKEGDIYGFVGENGAGKTTFMKMIMGLTYQTSGSFIIMNESNVKIQRKKMGCTIETPSLYLDRTARENMEIFSLAFGCKSSKRINEILEVVNLRNVDHKKVGKYSLGMKQRLAIALALLGDPKILILDEPINGLDPIGIQEIRNLIYKLNNEEGITFLISSHILEELSKIATKYGIIHKGVLIEEINPSEFYDNSFLKIRLSRPAEAKKVICNKLKGIQCELIDDNCIKVNDYRGSVNNILSLLLENNQEVYEIVHKKESLEDYVLNMIRKEDENGTFRNL